MAARKKKEVHLKKMKPEEQSKFQKATQKEVKTNLASSATWTLPRHSILETGYKENYTLKFHQRASQEFQTVSFYDYRRPATASLMVPMPGTSISPEYSKNWAMKRAEQTRVSSFYGEEKRGDPGNHRAGNR